MSRLGRRQRDVLAAAAKGTSTVWHVSRGRMAVSGVVDVYGDDVIDRLLDLGLVRLEEHPRGGHYVRLTEAGAAALSGAEFGSSIPSQEEE